MRHAKSSWKYPDLSDHERPLKKRGRKASVKIAKELIKLNWIPDKLYSSDSERTRETWKKMNKYIKDIEVEYSRKFYHRLLKYLERCFRVCKEFCHVSLLPELYP